MLLVSITIISCGKKESSENIPGDKKDTTAQLNKEKPADLKWEFNLVGKGNHDEPITDVYLVIKDEKIPIEKIEFAFSEFKKSNYNDYHIPENAIMACRGWWAGAGIDYWVIMNSGRYEVYSREIGETTNESGEPGDYQGKPKMIKTIKAE